MHYAFSVATDEKQAIVSEFDRLIGESDRSLDALIRGYEPLEALYRDATASGEVVAEVVNTTTLPRSLITTATSAR